MTEHYSQVSAQEKLAAQHLAFGDVLATARKKTLSFTTRRSATSLTSTLRCEDVRLRSRCAF